MRRFVWSMGLGALLLGVSTPATAAPGTVGLSASVGSGVALGEGVRIPTNVMIAPGVGIINDVIRAEVGLLAELDDLEGGGRSIGLGVRPMITIDPPLVPLHGRVIASFQDLGGQNSIAVGGALGSSLGLGPVRAFAEVGYIPVFAPGDFTSVVEGRLGATVSF